MTLAQEYASDFAKRVAVGIVPEQAESVRLRIDDFERFIAIAFLAGSKHSLDVQVEMVNQSARDMYSQTRMQASEAFQASKLAVFDRSVLDKLTRYQDDEYCGAIPDPDGEYVKLEDVVRLTEEPK